MRLGNRKCRIKDDGREENRHEQVAIKRQIIDVTVGHQLGHYTTQSSDQDANAGLRYEVDVLHPMDNILGTFRQQQNDHGKEQMKVGKYIIRSAVLGVVLLQSTATLVRREVYEIVVVVVRFVVGLVVLGTSGGSVGILQPIARIVGIGRTLEKVEEILGTSGVVVVLIAIVVVAIVISLSIIITIVLLYPPPWLSITTSLGFFSQCECKWRKVIFLVQCKLGDMFIFLAQ